MAAFNAAELEVKCTTIEFNSNPLGIWSKKVPYAHLLSCKSARDLAMAPEAADEEEIPYPIAAREAVINKVAEFLAHYSANPQELDDVLEANKALGWKTVGDKKEPVLVSEKFSAFYSDFIDIPMSHPDHGFVAEEKSWENSKKEKFALKDLWKNLPVVEGEALRGPSTETNRKGVIRFEPRPEDPVVLLDLIMVADNLKCKPLFKLIVSKMGELLKGKTFTGQMELFMLANIWFEEHKQNRFFNYKEMKGYQEKYMPAKSGAAAATTAGGSAVAAGGGN